MPPVTTCTSCGRHVLGEEASCPHCGRVSAGSSLRTFAAVALGLSMVAGCPLGGNTNVDYGTSGSYSDADADADADSDADADADTDSDADADPTGDTGP